MTKMTRLIAKPLLAAVVLCTAATGAMAQRAGAPSQAGMIDRIKSELKITDAQTPAWNSFVGVYDQQFKPSRSPSVQEFNAMTTPERIALLKGLLNEETAFMMRRYDANVTLYNQLTPEQKKKFDEMTATADRGAPAPAAKSKKK